MDEMEVILTEARSLIAETSVQVEMAVETADSPSDAKEALHTAIRLGEEARDRLEEAMDFAEAEEQALAIDESLRYIEDAVDAAQLSFSGGDLQTLINEMKFQIEQASACLDRIPELEVE